jgi:hypothetical protein
MKRIVVPPKGYGSRNGVGCTDAVAFPGLDVSLSLEHFSAIGMVQLQYEGKEGEGGQVCPELHFAMWNCHGAHRLS